MYSGASKKDFGLDISDHARHVKCLGNCGNLLLKLEPGKSIESGQAKQLSSDKDLSENILDAFRNCFSPPAIYHKQCG